LFPVNVSNRILSNTDLYEVKYFSNEWSEKANKITLDRMYQSLKSEKIYFVDTYNIFCEQIQKGYCVGADRNNIYIYDDNHPSDVGGKLIIQEIKEIINKLNKQ
jgi:hypothetical protein